MARHGVTLRRRHLLRGLAALSLGAMPACRCTPKPEPSSSDTIERPTGLAAAPRTAPPRGPSVLRAITYNVLASPLRVDERIPALLSLLSQSDADIIALQEVAPWFMRRLRAQSWVRDYHESTINRRRAYPGGQYILSRHPIGDCFAELLPGGQRRTALYADVLVRGTPLRVATTHMESYLEDGPLRAVQLDRMFSRLRAAPNALLLGDLNFGDDEPESSHLDRSYVDIWTQLCPDQPGFTWDIERSTLARDSSFPGEPSRRLDRILLRSDVWRGSSISIVGDEPIHAGRLDLFPSDHFGLLADLATRG